MRSKARNAFKRVDYFEWLIDFLRPRWPSLVVS